MRRVIRTALAALMLGAVLLTFCLMPLAAAPEPVPPPPTPPPPPNAPTHTGHEAYPFAGDAPTGHEQGIIFNSFATPEQKGLYNKFVGFYHAPT